MNPELEATIHDAYRVFAGYEVRHSLSVCHCPNCMTVETGRELLTTPLRQISSGLLSEYTNSAHGWDDGPVAREMRYFLPRYLELIAAYDPPDGLGLVICLRRLGQAQWRQKWPEAEADVLERFFDRFELACLQRLDKELLASGWRLAFNFKDFLSFAVTAGANLDRILATWKAAEDPAAAIHMASLRLHMAEERRGPYLDLCSPYLDPHCDEARRIGAFLAHPEVMGRIFVSLSLVTDVNMHQLLSDAMYIDFS